MPDLSKWDEIALSPEYGQYGPEEQKLIKTQWFKNEFSSTPEWQEYDDGQKSVIMSNFQSYEPPRPDRSMLVEARDAFTRGIDAVGESVGGTMEMAGIPGGKWVKDLYTERGSRPGIQKAEHLQGGTVVDHPERLADAKWWVNLIGENLPMMGAMMAPGAAAYRGAKALGAGTKLATKVATGGAATGAFTVEAGSAYNDAKEEMIQMGYGEEEADTIATNEGLVVGAVNSMLEVAPFNVLLKNPGSKKLFARLVRQALWEGGTEAVQENVNMLAAEMGHNPDTKWQDWLGRTIESGLGGVVLGGGVGAFSGAGQQDAKETPKQDPETIDEPVTVEQKTEMPEDLEAPPPNVPDIETVKKPTTLSERSDEDIQGEIDALHAQYPRRKEKPNQWDMPPETEARIQELGEEQDRRMTPQEKQRREMSDRRDQIVKLAPYVARGGKRDATRWNELPLQQLDKDTQDEATAENQLNPDDAVSSKVKRQAESHIGPQANIPIHRGGRPVAKINAEKFQSRKAKREAEEQENVKNFEDLEDQFHDDALNNKPMMSRSESAKTLGRRVSTDEYRNRLRRSYRLGTKARKAGALPDSGPTTETVPPPAESVVEAAPDKTKEPWEMKKDEWIKFAETGKIRKASGKAIPGENEAQTAIKMGELNGYTPQDIAQFYLRIRTYNDGTRTKDMEEMAHKGYLEHALAEGKPVPQEVLKEYPDLDRRKPPIDPGGAPELKQSPKAAQGKVQPDRRRPKSDIKEGQRVETPNASSTQKKSVSQKPRLAETAEDLWDAIFDKTERGVVSEKGDIFYPVVRIIGEGDFRVSSDGVSKISKDGVVFKPATQSQLAMIEKDIESDTAEVLLRTKWGGPGKNPVSKDDAVLHSPSGLSFKGKTSLKSGKVKQISKDSGGASTPTKTDKKAARLSNPLKNQDGSSQILTDVVNIFAKDQTESPAFKKWSKGYSVIKEHDQATFRTGEGVVVQALHGSPAGDRINVFESEHLDSGQYSGSSNNYLGWHFTTDRGSAAEYASGYDADNGEGDYDAFERSLDGENIVNAFIRLDNPLVMAGYQYDKFIEGAPKDADSLEKFLDSNGHDGVVVVWGGEVTPKEKFKKLYMDAYNDVVDELTEKYESLEKEEQARIERVDDAFHSWSSVSAGSVPLADNVRDLYSSILGRDPFDGLPETTRDISVSVVGDTQLYGEQVLYRSEKNAVWVVVRPDAADRGQIKSVLGNSGKFDPNDPSIIGESQLIADVARKAADLIIDGVDSFRKFKAEMRKAFREVWGKIRKYMRSLFDMVKGQKGSSEILNDATRKAADKISTKKAKPISKIKDDIETGGTLKKETKKKQHTAEQAKSEVNKDIPSIIAKVAVFLKNPKYTKKSKTDLSYFGDLMASIPSFFAEKIEATRKIFEASQDKQDEFHEGIHWMENHDDVSVVESWSALKKGGGLRKATKYIVSNDRKGIGYRIKKLGTKWFVRDIDPNNKKPLAEFRSNITSDFVDTGEVAAVEKMVELEKAHLESKGFTPEQVKAIIAFRLSTNKGFDTLMASMRRLLQSAEEAKMKPPEVVTFAGGEKVRVSLKQAMAQMSDIRGFYFPRIRKPGKNILRAYKDGEYNILETFTTRRMMNVRKLELEKDGYKVETSRNEQLGEDVFQMAGGLVATQQIVNSALDRVETKLKNPGKDQIEGMQKEIEFIFASALAEQIANVIRERGSRVHMTSRSDDVYIGYEEDPEQVIAKYIRGISAGEAKRNMVMKMLRALTGTDVSWKQFKSENPKANYDEYAAMVNENMIDQAKQPNAFKWAINYIGENTRNQEAADRAIGIVKGIAVAKYLAFRVFSSPLVNLTALPTSTIASMKAAGVPYLKTYRLLGSAAKSYLKWRAGKGKLSKSDKAIFDYIRQKGWDNPQFNSEAMTTLRSALGRKYDKVIEYGMWTFSESERTNRAATIAATYKGLKAANPSLGFESLMEKAKDVSDKSHGIYNKGNYPYIALGRHPAAHIVRMFYVFRTFSHTYLANMHRVGFKEKDYGALAHMMIAPAVIAGAGASVLTPLISSILKAFGVDEPEEQAYLKIGEMFGPKPESFARFGATSMLPGGGFSIKGSLAIGIGDLPTKMTVKDFLGAPGSVIDEIFHLAPVSLLRGDVAKGFERALPTGIGNIIRSYREHTEGITTRNNAPVFYGKDQLKLSLVESIYRGFSFNPARIAGAREKQWKERKLDLKYRDFRTDIYAKIKKYIFSGNKDKNKWAEIMGEIMRYNEYARSRKLSMISTKTIKANLRRSSRPNKRERMRRNLD